MKRIFFVFGGFVLFVSCFAFPAFANNLSVSNVVLANATGGAADVTFDVQWDHSWRDATNHDALWVFLKYTTDSGDTWEHGTLYGSGVNPTGYDVGSGTAIEIDVASDGMGAFIRRSAIGSGSTNVSSVKFRWAFGLDGLSGTNTVSVSVQAIEMVQIPEGSFWLGDADGDQFVNFREKAVTTNPVNVTSAMSVVMTCAASADDDATLQTTGICVDGDGGLYESNGTTIINADFPTGYTEFYCMKYEISQEQYRDFLNMLTRTQQASRCSAVTAGNYMNDDDVTAAVTNRNGIKCTDPVGSPSRRVYVCNFDGDGNNNEANDGQEIACNWLSWADLAAYADWAGLRPITELEFEKACRGTASPVDDEYAWGNENLYDLVSITNDGYGDAVRNTPTNANCNYGNTDILGPVRCGLFAAGASSREMAGASFYGVMEMSGNLWKPFVTVGHATGRSFTGLHGDGELDASGDAGVTNWPGTDAIGSGWRCGSWRNDFYLSRVANRSIAAYVTTVRTYDEGGRCARTA